MDRFEPNALDCDRAGGGAVCNHCGLTLDEHSVITGLDDPLRFHGLAVDCEGRVWKL